MTARANPTSELNVTPMLDVLLVLLITFMAATIQTRPTIDVNLPQPCAGVCEAGDEDIVLEVLPGPTYRVNRTDVPPSQLRGYLTSVYRGRPTKILQVGGDPHVSYNEVIAAMDVAKSAGVSVIGILPKR
ncbi:MAG TPA: biopolymer transporter ExbD [Gemmatimonadaceae bacterium]